MKITPANWSAFLPWAVTENYSKVKSGFSYLKAFQQHGGTPDEISNSQADILYIMGVMGHYVGDASQPLHTTVHHHGWVGENPNHYSTNGSIHGFIDGFFKKDAAALFANAKPKLRPAQVIIGRPVRRQTCRTRHSYFRFILNFLVTSRNKSNRSINWTKTTSSMARPAKAKRFWRPKFSSPRSCSATSGIQHGSRHQRTVI